jgi:D-alanyl-D-alanine dipeptidase
MSTAANNDSLPNIYHLKVLNQSSEMKASIKASEFNKMVDIKRIIPDIRLELTYTTPENFMHTVLYSPTTTTFLRLPAALALKKVQDALRKENLSLKIWDAYRPYSVTLKMWDLIHDDRYVADPAKGSGHNRGIAVDLTIVSLKDGKELEMGTGFDNFTDSAHQDYIKLSENVLNNRKLLRNLMVENGFAIFPTEWWHYYYSEGQFDILDFSFEDLMKNEPKQKRNEH